MKSIWLKTFLWAVLAAPVLAVAGVQIRSAIGPTLTTVQANVPVTIAAGGAGVRNCLTNLDASSTAAFTLRILNGGTTMYAVIASSGATLIRSWDIEQQFCGSANTALYIQVDAGTGTISHQGFTY